MPAIPTTCSPPTDQAAEPPDRAWLAPICDVHPSGESLRVSYDVISPLAIRRLATDRLQVLTTYSVHVRTFAASLIGGVSGDDPEGGARRGVPRRAARNRSPREAREVARQALRPGCEELAARIGGHAGDGSAAPRPKTATVERREASVPRYGTQGASQAPGLLRHVQA